MSEPLEEQEVVEGYVMKWKKGVPTIIMILGRRYILAPQSVGPGKKGRKEV